MGSRRPCKASWNISKIRPHKTIEASQHLIRRYMALEGTILRCKAMQLYSAIMPYICILMQPNKCIYGRKKCYSLIPRFPKLGIFAAAGQVSTVSRFLCCGQSNPLRHSGREVPFGFICLTIRCANFEPQNGPRKKGPQQVE